MSFIALLHLLLKVHRGVLRFNRNDTLWQTYKVSLLIVIVNYLETKLIKRKSLAVMTKFNIVLA